MVRSRHRSMAICSGRGKGRHPAMVFLHGCGGLFGRHGAIVSRERTGRRDQCRGHQRVDGRQLRPAPPGGDVRTGAFRCGGLLARAPRCLCGVALPAGAGLRAPDRIGVIGWSAGGGTVLNTIRTYSPARPDVCPAATSRPPSPSIRPVAAPAPGRRVVQPDAFARAGRGQRCLDPRRTLPRLDRTPRGLDPAEIHVYPGAYHDFDWPNAGSRGAAFRTRAGVVPIEGRDPSAKADAVQRVTAFVAGWLQAP